MARNIPDRRIEAKYTPDGARVTKKKIWDGATAYNHKYIVDPTGRVPAVLLVLDAEDNDAILNTYIHADGKVIAQHPGPAYNPPPNNNRPYFYLHDRLGSVRQIIYSDGNVVNVVNCYTYDPWGLPVGNETQETISNMYLFANYAWDSEILQDHCFRRQYDPVLARFTSRDPVNGQHGEPMTLHKYLYCLNNPINDKDPTGELAIGGFIGETITGLESYYTGLDIGLQMAGGSWEGVLDAAISINDFRETYFSYKGARRPVELVDMAKAFGTIYNACDWGGLAGCFGKILGDKIASEFHNEYGVPEALASMGGTAACVACASPITLGVDKLVTCGLCGGYLAYHGYSWYQIGNRITGCVLDNCQ